MILIKIGMHCPEDVIPDLYLENKKKTEQTGVLYFLES
jgi:hypothetical protein